MQDIIYNTLDSLDEIIEKAQGILHPLNIQMPLELLAGMHDDVAKIRNRLNDARFYVGIIGEFSCGKSTFVNAFIEKRYLTEDILQGTTCAQTHISYCEDENVIVYYNNGSTRKMSEDCIIDKVINTIKQYCTSADSTEHYEDASAKEKNQDRIVGNAISTIKNLKYLDIEYICGKLRDVIAQKEKLTSACADVLSSVKNSTQPTVRDFLQRVTAVEAEARDIAQVDWLAPIDVLRDGMVIIDTPGIGSLNPRHTEVAREAARHCDALMVLTPLGAGVLSAELVEAVKQIAGEAAENCIFVGTCADRLPPREHERMCKHFATKIKKTFGQERPYYFVSAYNALKDLTRSQAGEQEALDNLIAFRHFRTEVRQRLNTSRQYIQCGKVSVLAADLVRTLDKELEASEAALRKQSEKFRSAAINLDSTLWSQLQRSLHADLDHDIGDILKNARDAFISIQENMLLEVISKVKHCDSESELKHCVEVDVEYTLEKYHEELENFINKHIETPVFIKVQEKINIFHGEFKKNHRKLADILGIPIQVDSAESRFSGISSSDVATDTDSVRALLDSIDAEDGSKILGGLATGIAVSVAIPGVGWIVGGALTILAGLLSAIFGTKSLSERKEEVIAEFENKISIFFDDLIPKFNDATNHIVEHYINLFDRSVEYQRKLHIKIIHEHNISLHNKKQNIDDSRSSVNCLRSDLEMIESKLHKLREDIAYHSNI